MSLQNKNVNLQSKGSMCLDDTAYIYTLGQVSKAVLNCGYSSAIRVNSVPVGVII